MRRCGSRSTFHPACTAASPPASRSSSPSPPRTQDRGQRTEREGRARVRAGQTRIEVRPYLSLGFCLLLADVALQPPERLLTQRLQREPQRLRNDRVGGFLALLRHLSQ